MKTTITDQRIETIAALAGVSVATATEIIDRDYTYWSQRGDSTREEHIEFLAGPDQAIADWVRSVAGEGNPAATVTCERCDGTGVITSHVEGFADELSDRGEESESLGVGVECPDCDGCGEVEASA